MLEEAQSEVEEVLKLDSSFAISHGMLGEILILKGEWEAGIAESKLALRMDPNLKRAHYNLVTAYESTGETGKVIEHLENACRLAPEDPAPLQKLAWLHATHTDAKYRNGEKAVALASQLHALAGGRDLEHAGTLAAAYAESGNFEKAVETMENAVKLAEAGGNPGLVSSFHERLRMFRAGLPYRNPEAKEKAGRGSWRRVAFHHGRLISKVP